MEARNDRIRIIEERVLADDWYVLKKTTFEYLCRNMLLQHAALVGLEKLRDAA